MKEYEYQHRGGKSFSEIRRDKINRMHSDKKRVARKKAKEDETQKIQAKLEIGASDDAYEKHADAVAQKVVAGENASHLLKNTPTVNTQPQTKEEEGTLMAKSDNGTLTGTDQLQTTLNSSKGGGQNLDTNTQNEMSEKMGTDLSGVKIHTDSKANEMSEGINAKAFTHGQDIYFNHGNFDTSSTEGKSLLAHELAHTVQQKGGLNRMIQRKKTENDPLVSEFFTQDPLFSKINDDDSVLMQKNDENHAVKLLQQALIELNYSLPKYGADGSYGDETVQALKNFQIDSGMKGSEVDGVLGHKTLRLLDERFAAVSKKNFVGYNDSGGPANSFAFNISVPYKMTYAEFLPHALIEIFNISPIEANTMVKGGWYINNWHEISETEVSVGHKRISITKERYEKIKGKANYTYGTEDDKEEKKTNRQDVEESYNKLSGTEKLYELNEKVRKQRAYIDGLHAWDKEDMKRVHDEKMKANEKLREMIAERDAELLRLGLTVDIFEKDQDDFIKAFFAFSYETAFKMLRENETSVRIELDRYQKLAAVNEIGTILKELYKYNNDADRLWWKGLSYAETGNPDEIYGEDSLRRKYPDIDPDPKINTTTETVLRIKAKYEQYKYNVRGGNAYFEQSYDTKHQQYGLLQEKATEYPMLAHPDLQVDKLGEVDKKTDKDLQTLLLKTIEGEDKQGGILGAIKTTRANLEADPEKIWELNPVIQRARGEMGIIPGSIHDTLINKKVKQASEMSWWEIAMAAFGILLGVLALLSGPIGWVALAGSLTVGAIEAKIAYDKASVNDAAHGAAMDPSKALSEVPGNWLWFYLSLVCIGMDALVVFRLIKVGVKSLGEASKTISLLDRIANGTIKTAEEYVEATKELITLSQSETKRLLSVQSKIIEGTKDVSKIKAATQEIEKLTTELFGIEKSLKDVSDPTFLAKSKILMSVVDNPVIFKNMAEAMFNPKYSEAFLKLEAMLVKHPDLLADIVRFYGGAGKAWLEQFPEVMRVLEKSNIKPGTDLFKELMTQPKVQKVFLDNQETPDLLLEAWEKWVKAKTRTKPPPVQIPFVNYLSQGLGFKTSMKTTTKLTEKFGKGFLALDNLTKNRQLLRESDKLLTDALNQNLLPTKVEKAILDLFDTDIIKGAQTFESARGMLSKKLNEVIGKNIDNVDEFKKVIGFIEQPGSRGSIGEHYAISKKLLGGVDDVITHPKPIDVSELGLKNPQKFHPDELIVNQNSGILGDIKTGYPTGGVDLDQVDNYISIFVNRFDDKYKELFKAIGIEPQNFKGIEYLMLPGKTGNTFAAAEKTYLNILKSPGAKEMLENGNFVVKYLDETDNIVKIFKPY